ncbi:MAG: hypothetical protein Q9178_000250 [Gyalolechia marmorata]
MCTDISCSEFVTESSGSSGDGNSDGEESPPSASRPSISSPDLSPPTTNRAGSTRLPDPTIPPLPTVGRGAGGAAAITSFTFSTITAQSTVGAVMRTFTTTVTISYYILFITTTTFVRLESSFITSSWTSATKDVTALATDSADARNVFWSLESSLRDAPTLRVSGRGVAGFSQTRSSTARSRATGGAGEAGDGTFLSAGGRSTGTWEWGLLIWGMVGIGVGAGMVLL